MKNVRTCFVLTMLLLTLCFSAYADDFSRQGLIAPCGLSEAGRSDAVFADADLIQSANFVRVDIAYEPTPHWCPRDTYRNGQADGELVNPYLLHADLHLNRHVKLGAGYNFDGLSDDLAEFETDNEGVFIYLIGKM